MDFELYRGLMLDSVIKEYPMYLKRSLLNSLSDKGIVKFKDFKDSDKENNILDLTLYPDINMKLTVAIAQDNRVLKQIEKFELNKCYRYSCMLDFEGDIQNKITEEINKGNILEIGNQYFENESIDKVINKPIIYRRNQKIFLKFNLLKYTTTEDGDLKMKYPVLVVINTESRILEINFDTLKTVYKSTNNYYEELIKCVRTWIKGLLGIETVNIDFKKVERYIEKNKKDVILYAQSLRTNSGSKIVLDINSDEECILPILGGLKNLMNENKDEFDKAPQIKTLLQDFIEEIKETSDSEWFKLYWKDTFDSDGILISIYHTYHAENYSLIQYHNNLKDMERMEYVNNYLTQCRNEIKESSES